jgi:hypothetical protein
MTAQFDEMQRKLQNLYMIKHIDSQNVVGNDAK